MPTQRPQIWKDQRSSWRREPQPRALWHAILKGGVVMNEGLLEVESAVFSIAFCKPAANKKRKYISLHSCVRSQARLTSFYWITARKEQTHGKLLPWHRHRWCCVWNQRIIFSKKEEKLTKNSWTCYCPVTEMRSSAEGVLSSTMMVLLHLIRAGYVRNDGSHLILVVGLCVLQGCPKTSAPSWLKPFGLGDGWGTVLGKK